MIPHFVDSIVIPTAWDSWPPLARLLCSREHRLEGSLDATSCNSCSAAAWSWDQHRAVTSCTIPWAALWALRVGQTASSVDLTANQVLVSVKFQVCVPIRTGTKVCTRSTVSHAFPCKYCAGNTLSTCSIALLSTHRILRVCHHACN